MAVEAGAPSEHDEEDKATPVAALEAGRALLGVNSTLPAHSLPPPPHSRRNMWGMESHLLRLVLSRCS
jgi:hypothetical protein